MEPMKKKPNYRGVKEAYLIIVLEGDGTEKAPFENVEYVLTADQYGLKTIGKVVPLKDDEIAFKKFWAMKIALLDVETTGLDAQLHEILEIAVVVFDDETLEILDTYEAKVLPTHIETAHPKALQVNGYSLHEWRKAVPLEDMMRSLSAGTTDCILMAFNKHFDLSFLDQAIRSTGIELHSKRITLDLRDYAWNQMDHRNPFLTWSMRETCLRLGVTPEPTQHRAMNGVLCEYEIYKALKTHTYEQNKAPTATAHYTTYGKSAVGDK